MGEPEGGSYARRRWLLSDGNLPTTTGHRILPRTGDYRIGEKNRVHALFLSTDESKEIPETDRGFDPNALKTRRDLLAGVRWRSM